MALRLAALAFLSGLAACTSGSSPGTTATAGDPWRGELATYVVNRGGGQSELEYRLRGDDGVVRPLLFPGGSPGAMAALEPGTGLRIWGREDASGAISVDRHEFGESPLTTVSSALLNGTAKPKRRWAFVLLDIDGAGNPINKANAQSVLFNPDRPDSIRSYFKEISYGLQDLEGDVIGPIPYQMGGRCDTDRVAAALRAQIPGQYDQYLWFFGTQQAECNWAGIAELGRADRPTRHSWYNSFHSCTVLVQEPGHNFGMVHSSAMRCTIAGQPTSIAWPGQGGQCEHVEYGNPFDPMGGGDCFHMNGVQKAYQDWLGGCNVVKATESGTFTIRPLESACDGPQILQIPLPQPRTFGRAGVLTSYYLELRAPLGRDARLPPQVQVLVANDVREARFTGNNNWLLDMTPETMKLGDEGLPVGKPFVDGLPGGPKFTLLSVDKDKAVIQVELAGKPPATDQIGKAVCSDGKTYDPTTPVRCEAPLTPATPPPMVRPPDAGSPTPTDAGLGAPDAGPPPATPDAAPASTAEDAGAPPARDAPVRMDPSGQVAPPQPPSSGGCSVAPLTGGDHPGWIPLLLALGLALSRIRRRSRP